MVTILTSGLISRPTHAESFLSKATCGIFELLGAQCQSVAPSTRQVAPSTPTSNGQVGQGTPPATDHQATSADQSAAQPIPANFTPISLPQNSLETVKPLPTDMHSMAVTPSRYATYNFPGATDTGDASVLGSTTQAPLQPSAEGWKVFGIYWYWWVLLAIVVLIGWRITKDFLRRANRRRYEPEHS